MRRLLPILVLPGCKLFVDPTIAETCEDVGECGGGGGDDTGAVVEGDADGDGFTVDAGDCDDTDPAVNPDAVEVCDGSTDEDCDGLVDDADPDVTGQVSSWADADGDGWGDGDATLSCEPPADAATQDGDCADDDADVNPGATEVCANGVDDDCDGTSNGCRPYEGQQSRDEAAGAVLRNATSDYFGFWSVGGDFDADGARDLVTSDPEAGPTDNGTVSLYRGLARGAVVNAPSDAAATFLGPSGTNQGLFVAAGDGTGDGQDDIAFLSNDGTLHVLPGPLSGTLRTGDAWLIAENLRGSSLDGSPLLLADGTGDGRADLIVGDYYAGALYLVPGPLPRRTDDISDLATRKLVGGTDGDPGWAVVTGDFAGDGVADVATSDPFAGTTTSTTGRVWLLRDGVPSGGVVDDLVHTAAGERDEGHFGGALAACDLDDDGADDLVVGASGIYNDDKGVVYVFSGGLTGATTAASADIRLDAGEEGAFGYTLACGDFDGDGAQDIVIGEPVAAIDGEQSGAAHLWYGPVTAPRGPDASLTGGAVGVYYGAAVDTVGDLDGDGADEFTVAGQIAALDVLFGGGL